MLFRSLVSLVTPQPPAQAMQEFEDTVESVATGEVRDRSAEAPTS